MSSFKHKVKQPDMTLDSLLEAIKLKCKDCCSGDLLEISKCEIEDCPLYKFRTLKKDST